MLAPRRVPPPTAGERDEERRTDRRDTWVAVRDLAHRQHGAVARRQLRVLGLTDAQIDGALRDGRLIVVHRGVFAVGHARLSATGRAVAAALACGPGAAVAYRSGAALWEIRPSSTRTVEVVVPRASAVRHRGLTAHRHPSIGRDEVTTLGGVPVTTACRTLLDLAAVLPPDQLRKAIKQAEVLGLFDLGEVLRLLHRHPRHRGATRLRSMLRTWTDPPTTRSDLEAAFVELCATHDLPRPSMNGTVLGMEIDAQFPAHGIAVELDGRRYHENPLQREDDYAKRATLEAAGLRFVAFTYRQVLADGGRFPAMVLRRMIDRGR